MEPSKAQPQPTNAHLEIANGHFGIPQGQ